jgi:DNA-binding transcriptional ArsR family regulator
LFYYQIMEDVHATDIFSCLASPVRLQVFRLLLECEPHGLVAGEIASRLDVPPANLSFHLKALAHVGLVCHAQQGRFQRYRADVPLMQEVLDYMTGMCCAGHPEHCLPPDQVRQAKPQEVDRGA